MKENELDIDYIKEKIQNTLNKEFTDHERRRIKEFPERLNCCCSICGDSDKDKSKKRLNFYKKNCRFICFNCGANMSIIEYFNHHNVELDMDQKLSIYNYIDEHAKIKNNNSDYILEELDKLIDLDKFITYFNEKQNSWLYDIKPVQKGSKVYKYLTGRMVFDHSQIYQGIYRIVKDGKVKYKTDVMINMNMLLSDNKLIGIQLRNLEKDKTKRFFKIVDFEELYNYMNPTEKIDEITAIPYNKLSHFFNILNINFEKPITIFEGYIDSIYYTNSIGLIGSNSTDDIMRFLLESDEGLDIRFFLDNDDTGIKKAQYLLKKGFSVFLWKKLFEKLSKNKYDAEDKLKDIKDLNDLVVRSNNVNIADKLKLDNFFAKDEFDKIYLI